MLCVVKLKFIALLASFMSTQSTDALKEQTSGECNEPGRAKDVETIYYGMEVKPALLEKCDRSWNARRPNKTEFQKNKLRLNLCKYG